MLRVILIAGWKGLIFIRKAPVSTICQSARYSRLIPTRATATLHCSLGKFPYVCSWVDDSPLALRMRRCWPRILKPSNFRFFGFLESKIIHLVQAFFVPGLEVSYLLLACRSKYTLSMTSFPLHAKSFIWLLLLG